MCVQKREIIICFENIYLLFVDFYNYSFTGEYSKTTVTVSRFQMSVDAPYMELRKCTTEQLFRFESLMD